MSGASSLRRGLALLAAIGSEDAIDGGGLGVTALADRLGMDKGQVSRMLRALADTGLVERDPTTRSYRLGWSLFTMATRGGKQRLLDLGTPALLELVDLVGERAHLTVLQGRSVVTVLTQSPPLALQAAGWVGRTVPAHCTSSGRALLLDHTLTDLERLFGQDPFPVVGHGGPVDAATLHTRICEARSHGYAISDQEFEEGLLAIAAPVRSSGGRIVAALNTSGPRFRLADQLEQVAAAVRSVAGALSHQLGHDPTHDLAMAGS
jgi:IclR family KDG regulon transcriptional repressor